MKSTPTAVTDKLNPTQARGLRAQTGIKAGPSSINFTKVEYAKIQVGGN